MKKAALMAAGDSTRMMPLSANLPKHLLPIAGQPLIFHTLHALKKAGIEEVLIIYGYRGEELRQAIDSRDWGKLRISYVLQKERRGTAHAAGHARGFAGDDEILLMNGDVLTDADDFAGVVKCHKKGGYALTTSGWPVEDPSAYGVFEVENGKASALIEKPKKDQTTSNLVNAGIYAVGPTLWDAIDRTELSSRKEYELTDSVMLLIEEGNVGVYTIQSWWMDVGKPWDLLKANRQILSTMKGDVQGEIENGATLKGDVIIESRALVRSGAYIEGPAYIGEGSVVGPNCYIRPYTYLVRDVKVGNGCEVKNSLVMTGTSIGHLSYVGDSVIGREVNFGAGTTTANLRHDDKPVHVTVKGKRISSGRRKLGVIIGDNVKTGIGTLLSPGVVIHQNARTGIGTIVNKDIGPGKLIQVKQQYSESEIDK